MTLEDLDRVDRYRLTIGRAWRHNGDANVWPIKLNAAIHLFVKEFGEELLDDLAWLEANGSTAAEIARAFGNPARLYRIIDSVVYSMRRNRVRLGEQRAVVLKLLTMTKALKYGSEFNEDGCNRIFSPAEVARLEAALDRPTLSASDAQLVHRFCGLMWAYTEAIFFRAHDVTKEIHGPYAGTGGGPIVVKEYLNLRPLELWPDVPLLPCHTIKISLQYTAAVRLRIDALNHLYHEGGPLVPNLEALLVEVDGTRCNLSALRELLPAAQQTITAISRYVDAATWNERVLKYAEIFWFRKKPLADRRGRDWQVPHAVRERIRHGRESEGRRVPLSGEASERLAMLTI